MRIPAGGAAAVLAAWLAAAPAAAQFEADSSAPVEITADAMEWRDEARVAVASGNADAVQGRYRLRADVLTAFLAERGGGEGADNRIRLILADGNVRLTTPGETVTGANGTYNVENGQVVLEGAVVLIQGDNVVRGDRLDMDLTTGVSRLTAEPESGGRVSAIFSPNADDEAEEADEAGGNGGAPGRAPE